MTYREFWDLYEGGHCMSEEQLGLEERENGRKEKFERRKGKEGRTIENESENV